MIIVTPWFSKRVSFQNVFSPYKNKKPAFSCSSGLKSTFRKLHFHDGLSVDRRPNWIEGLSKCLPTGAVL